MKNGKHLSQFIKYSVLNVLGMLGLSCYILADTFFISKGLGTNGLAALNLSIPIYSIIHGFGLMLGIGGATKFTFAKARNEIKQANKIFTGIMYMYAVLSILFLVSGLFFSKTITSVLRADSEIFNMTNTYIKVILIFAPAFMLNDIILCFTRNDGAPGLSMAAMLCGSFSNIVLDYVFVFPLKMGLFGAALATGIAPIISLSILSYYKFNNKNNFHIIKTRPEFSLSIKMVSLGFPSLITELSSGIVILVFNLIILQMEGNVGVAAYGIVANISLVVISVFTGIAQGIQPLISYEHGLKNFTSEKKYLKYALITTLLLSLIIYMIIFLFAPQITNVFNNESNIELFKMAVKGLKLYFLATVFAGLNIIFSNYFTSIGKSRPAHIITVLRGIAIIIPVTLLLSKLFEMEGVWLSFPVTELIVFMLCVYISHKVLKKSAITE